MQTPPPPLSQPDGCPVDPSMRSSLFSFLRPSSTPAPAKGGSGDGAKNGLPNSLEEEASYKQSPAEGQTFPLHTSREVRRQCEKEEGARQAEQRAL